MTSVFYSSKFSSKIKYVNSLRELGEIIPMEYVHIPPSIVKWVSLYSTSQKFRPEFFQFLLKFKQFNSGE